MRHQTRQPRLPEHRRSLCLRVAHCAGYDISGTVTATRQSYGYMSARYARSASSASLAMLSMFVTPVSVMTLVMSDAGVTSK